MDKKELEKRLMWYEKRYGPYIEKKGLHNWKNLFRKPTFNEWVILFMLIGLVFVGWSYKHDITACQEALKQAQGIWNLRLIP